MDTNTLGLELLREAELRSRIKLSHSTIWRLVRAGKFPPPLQLSTRAKGWRAADIEAWLAARAGIADTMSEAGSTERVERNRR